MQFASFGLKGADLKKQASLAFCKTAAKRYDTVVVACLCVLAETGLDVSSDGGPADWEHGRALAEEILGRLIANPIKEEANVVGA